MLGSLVLLQRTNGQVPYEPNMNDCTQHGECIFTYEPHLNDPSTRPQTGLCNAAQTSHSSRATSALPQQGASKVLGPKGRGLEALVSQRLELGVPPAHVRALARPAAVRPDDATALDTIQRRRRAAGDKRWLIKGGTTT